MEHILHLGSCDPLSEDPKLPPPIPPLPPPPPPLLDCGGLPTTKEDELALYEKKIPITILPATTILLLKKRIQLCT